MINQKSGTRKCSIQSSKGGSAVSVLLVIFQIICIIMVAHRSSNTQNTKVNPPGNDINVGLLVRQTQKLSKSLAHLKGKKQLLSNYGDVDIFTSLRPKMGKRYSDSCLEEKRLDAVRECRSKLIPLSLAEIDQEISDTRSKFDSTFVALSSSQISFDEYKKISKNAWQQELLSSQKVRKSHERKVNHLVQKLNIQFREGIPAKPEKKRKHKELKRLSNVEKNRVKNAGKRRKKHEMGQAEINHIKKSNLVYNMSSEEVPDSAFAFLALGSSFVPSKIGSKHDDIYDIKLFSRKLRWKAFFKSMPVMSGASNEDGKLLKAPKKLKPKNQESPGLPNKHIDEIIDKLSSSVESFKKSKPKTNLTHLEVQGLRWCIKKIKEKKLYFTRADKGGSIIILDSNVVNKDIQDTLQDPAKYVELKGDPRAKIKKEIEDMVEKFVADGTLSLVDRLYLTGKTEKGGHSHDHSFYVNAPYIYPLYKIHKLSMQQISEKTKPPTRMVTSAVGGPTYRIGVLLDSVLKPVAESYCKGELVKDTTEFLQVMNASQSEIVGSAHDDFNLAAMDVCALYPSIRIDLALLAVREVLDSNSSYSENEKQAIVDMLSYTLKNSVVHYRGKWYQAVEGAPTGNPEVPSVANIFVKYVIDQKMLSHPSVSPLNRLISRRRFLDDVWSIWSGSVDSFKVFLDAFNAVGKEFGISFTGECGKSVEFLDVTTSMEDDGKIKTTMFVKPTDSCRYLNRRSFHSNHTFHGMPYSQFRRAALICSDMEDRKTHINRMEKKFLDSGFSSKDLENAKTKALNLKRNDLLEGNKKKKVEEVITCVIYQDPGLRRELNLFFSTHQQELKRALGDVKLVVSERRHANISSLLFQKRGFSQNQLPRLVDQKCTSVRCKTRSTMELDRVLSLNGVQVKLDYRYNCASESVIYVAICKYCQGQGNQNMDNFYIGQTLNTLMSRCNGHRDKFKIDKFDQSALSLHIMDKHPDNFGDKLLNFDFGVIKSVNPLDLDRAEDCFIYITKADIIGLNRYKCAR